MTREMKQGKTQQLMGWRDPSIFPSHSMASLQLPGTSCSIVQNAGRIRTGSGLFVSSLLPAGVEHSEERKVCGSGREGQHTPCLQVTRKEPLVETFEL